MIDARYPIGEFTAPPMITEEIKKDWIQVLENFPSRLENLVKDLSEDQLNTPYREGGWTIRQVVHHCSDSHHHSYIRFKWSLTEDNPIIKPYEEAKWAELPDTIYYDINESLDLLKIIHQRWVFLLKKMTEDDFKKTFIHPDGSETVTLEKNLCIYDWHCKHHLQHIINAKKFHF